MKAVGLRLLLLILSSTTVVEGSVACNDDQLCEDLLWKGSECRNGFCSNPFEKGCLHAMLKAENNTVRTRRRLSRLRKFIRIRVCNSEDPPTAAAAGICRDHLQRGHGKDELYHGYREIRILSQNWESAYFSTWISQIILSELLDVPTTVESGDPDINNNFYQPENSLGYSAVAYNWEALRNARNQKDSDCTKVSRQNDQGEYQPCGHAMMEFWTGHESELERRHKEGTVETSEGLGVIGQQALFVPKFTAERDPTILNLHGIQGEGNRRKMAETFKRPTTWKQYCEEESATNCTVPDSVAKRPPQDESESERMHVKDLYTGYFRATEKNDCDANPTTCTGHIADFPCGWISYVVPQMYHNRIALTSDGKEPGSGGYSYQQLSDMWAAANETRSNLMTMWWTPEALHATYLGTETEMQRISLAWPTQACADNRITIQQRCYYEDNTEQYGDPLGACDESPQLLQKVIVNNLYTSTYSRKIPEAHRNPGYDTIKAFSISELQLGEILQSWMDRGVDKYGFDPRFATCQWVWDNLDHIESIIPRSYPRVARETSHYEDPFLLAALCLGVLATVLVVAATIKTYMVRDRFAIVYAQVEFVFLLLLGLFLVTVGAVVIVNEANDYTCILASWLVPVGYTMQLVPLIVKVSAIHKLIKAADRLRRLELPKTQLFGTVAVITSLVAVYLACWWIFDPQHAKNEFIVTEEVDEDGATIVSKVPYCHSESMFWEYLSMSWYMFLMLIAALLAFKTRKIREEFNESKTLVLTAYSHFLFLLFVLATVAFKGALPAAYLVGIRSVVYSTDTIITLIIYFIPKFTAKQPPSIYTSSNFLAAQFDSHQNGVSTPRLQVHSRERSEEYSTAPSMQGTDE